MRASFRDAGCQRSDGAGRNARYYRVRLRVGADISVVGYDDTEDSSCYIPPLTTIKQDFRLLGKTSVDRLLKLSQGQAVKSNQLLPVSLVKRKTTLPPNTQTTSPRTLADS
jgi:DNA-binding LacI/PurR family transcriptional regulator